MKLNLNSIVLFVQDVNKLKSFYVDILKLEIIEQFNADWLLLQAGNCTLGLHKIGEQYLEPGQETFKFDNNTKIVFETADDIYKIREQLLNQQVLVKEIKNFDSYDYFLCDGEDPEGNVFQLKQKKK